MTVSSPPTFEAIDVGYLDLPGAANSFLLRTDAGPVLIEAGPQAGLPTLELGLRARGVDPASIAHLFVTHVHLDHAGAAGAFARRGTVVHVHPLGEAHLVDPTKLIESSRRVHGAAYERFYGDPVPAPAERVAAEPAGARLDLGSHLIEAVETPGHARHHHAWLVRASNGSHSSGDLLFTGDVAATFVPGSRFIGIPTPPTDYDPEAWLRSIDSMRRIAPDQLVLTHGGAVHDPSAHLDSVRSRLIDEDRWQRAALATGESDDAILPRYRTWLHAQAIAAGTHAHAREVFIGNAWMRMNLAGVRRAVTRGAIAI